MGINLLQETHISFVSWQKGMGSPPVAVGNHPCYWENLLEMDTLWQFHITILWKNYHLLFSYIYKWATVHSYVVVDLKVYMDLFDWSSVWLLSCSCIHSPKNMMPNWSQYLMLDDVSNPSLWESTMKRWIFHDFPPFFSVIVPFAHGNHGKKNGNCPASPGWCCPWSAAESRWHLALLALANNVRRCHWTIPWLQLW